VEKVERLVRVDDRQSLNGQERSLGEISSSS
jgi:hypothetical protein